MMLQLRGIIGLVAEREVRQRVRGRAFRVATALILLGVAGGILIPAWTGSSDEPRHVGVVGTLSKADQSAVTTAARGLGTTTELSTEPDSATALQRLREGELAVVIDGDSVVVHKPLDNRDTSQLARAIASGLGSSRAITAAGLTPQQINALAAAKPLAIHSLEGKRATSTETATAVIGLIVMFVLLSQYLTWTLTGVMEEKSSRVVEVLLGTLRPRQLLAGKLLGIGAVVFGQAALVAVVALVLGRATGSNVLHGAGTLTLLAFALWVLLGYVLYSWLYAAAGSMAERQEQVQSLAIPLMLPMLLGYIVSISMITSGGGTLLTVLAYIPPTAPFAMPSLVALHDVQWWQFAASCLLTLATTVLIARFAAGVYRRAILRTGGRVRLRDVLRSSA